MTSALTLDRLCVHQASLMQCDFAGSVECLARNGVGQTAIWGAKLDEVGAEAGARLLRDAGVVSGSLCFGELLTQPRDFNRRRIEQAATVGAQSLVMLTGGLADGERDLEAARDRAAEVLASLVPEACAAGITLALEPLHPAVCGLRSVISSVEEAQDIIERIGVPELGIALDSYGLWWDQGLASQIASAGSWITNFHVADWLAETSDVRLDRGMPGDGLIDNRKIRGWLEDTGFDGPVEIEIFSRDNWWQREPDDVIRTIIDRLPHL